MLKQKKHIKKVVVTVETSTMEQALAIKQQSDVVFGVSFYELLEQILEEILQKYPSNKKYIFPEIATEISIEKVESLADLKTEISTKIKAEIEAAIQQKTSEEILQESTPLSSNSYDVFFYFLENGYYPWWGDYDKKSIRKDLNNWINEVEFVKILNDKLKKSNTLERFIYYVDNVMLKKYFIKFLDLSKTIDSPVFELANEKKSKHTRLLYWAPLFYYTFSKDITKFIKKFDEILHIYNSVINEKSARIILNHSLKTVSFFEPISTQKKAAIESQIFETYRSNKTTTKREKLNSIKEESVFKEEQKFSSTETEFYVSNAGLMILHPFLESLFNKLGFLENGLLQQKSWDAATHTLYYLVTKQEQPHEHELLFIKYICGIPLKTPIYSFYKLSDTIKTECKNVLEATLHYWPSLKTNTTEILRAEFLMREGKLTLTNDIEKLYIPRKAQDILIDSIPWTIGVAKFPWKKELIYTEW